MTHRWLRYQREVFPVVSALVLAGVLAVAAIGYSVLLRDAASPVPPYLAIAAIPAGVCAFLFMVQFQIARILQSYRSVRPQRIYSPTQAGFVTPQELGILTVGSGLVQLGLTIPLGWTLLGLMMLIWGFFWLVRHERLLPIPPKARPFLALAQRGVAVGLVAVFALGCEWRLSGVYPVTRVGIFLLVCFLNGATAELAMRLRLPLPKSDAEIDADPESDRPTPATVKALRQREIVAWLVGLWLMALVALAAATLIEVMIPVAIAVLLLLTAAVFVAWRFLSTLSKLWAIAARSLSQWGGILLYLALGILPFYVRSL
ncbi:hypothetical protein ACQ4M4_02695 [Leptolyngbya sp. AN02str]|uniref:hypothetical protein n=1 Tax=Leptolyngbya sp. AN02str TaxID=3423363 RepID=UPI003D311E62